MRRLETKVLIQGLIFIVCFLLLALFFVNLEKLTNDDTQDPRKGATEYLHEMEEVFFDGEKYYRLKNISTYLLIGVDKEGIPTDSGSYVNTAQADVISLVVINNTTRSYSVIHLNRDTMTDITVLGLGGGKVRTDYAQLALAHTYGSGLKDSCENTVEAVSNLLFETQIDHYVSISMDVISIATDSLGGVTLTVPDDFPELGEQYRKDAVLTLNGKDATSFIRSRMSMNDPTNEARMLRQRCFIEAFMRRLSEVDLSDQDKLDFYDDLSPYSVTDCSAFDLNDLFDAAQNYRFDGFYIPDGEAVVGEEFMEYYVDDDSLRQLIVSLFYVKAED